MNILKISGEIGWDTTSREVENFLKNAVGDITVEISSVGGSVYHGIEIFNLLASYDNGSIHTINKSMAASIASYILMAGDKISTYDNATLMIHNAWTFTYGNHNDLRDTANHLEALSNIIAKKYAEVSKKSLDEIKEMMDKETFLYGEEIQENGFAFDVIKTEKKMPKDEAKALLYESIKACTASSKEHCKIDGYNEPIEKALSILAAMPSDEKIANQITKGAEMTVTKEEFDAMKSKYDETVASLQKQNNEISAKIGELSAKLQESHMAEVVAFCGANRDTISLAKEKEFVEAKATLNDVMAYALEQMKNDPADANANGDIDPFDKALDEAINKVNGGN